MTKRRGVFMIILMVVALAAVILSHTLVGSFTLTSYSLVGIPATYSVESNVLSTLGRNRLIVSGKSLEESLAALPYILRVDVKVKGKEITFSGETVEEGLIITDGENWYFYSDSLYSLDKKDVNDLKGKYVILLLDPAFLSLAVSSSFGGEELKMINTLKGLKESSCLITKAEYDNNNSSVFSGALLLRLDSIKSTLLLRDIREIVRLKETLGIIEKEYYDSKDRLPREETQYVLQNGALVKMR